MPAFVQQDLFDDDGLRAVQSRLLEDPEAGDLIPGGRGLRKLRAALPGRVSGVGARVIYYWRASHDLCYLVFAYAKTGQEDLNPAQVRALAALMREVLNDG